MKAPLYPHTTLGNSTLKAINSLTALISLIRPKHWVKNLIIFVPAFFSGRIDLFVTPDLVICFISFSIAASCIYIINDIIDIEKDRLHPVKRYRPLAAKVITIEYAVLFFGLLFFSLVILLFYEKLILSIYVMAYIVLNVFYSLKLKDVPIIDVACISLGFVLRVFAGSTAANGIMVSQWLIIIIFLITISIAFAKRRDDLILGGNDLRKSLNGYSLNFLNICIGMSFAVTLTSYIIYTVSPEVLKRFNSDKVYLTSFFVFLGIMRYLQKTFVEEKTGSPVEIFWTDRLLQVAMIGWTISFAYFIYWSNMIY